MLEADSNYFTILSERMFEKCPAVACIVFQEDKRDSTSKVRYRGLTRKRDFPQPASAGFVSIAAILVTTATLF
jgi:hypothetical protein